MVPDPRSWFRGPVRALRADSGLAWCLGAMVGGGAALAAWHWFRVPSIALWGFVSGLGAMVYYWTHYEWRDQPAGRRHWVWFSPASVASDLLTPEAAGFRYYFVVFAALLSLAHVVWYTAGLRVTEPPRSGGDSTASDRSESPQRDPPWQRAGWADRGGD